MVKVAVYCEGPLEWYVIYQLVRRNILENGEIEGDRNDISRWIKRPENLRDVDLNNLPNEIGRILLVFDQEQRNSPDEVKSILENRFDGLYFDTDTINSYSNIFIGYYQDTHIALFVSNIDSPDGNKDFDGYIVQVIERLGSEATRLWFEDARVNNRDDDRLPAYLRGLREQRNINYNIIHLLGLNDIPNIMNERQWDIQRSKTRLYAYITALQLNKSHVWFAEKLVKWAPENILREVFAPLIRAWEFLVEDSNEP